MYDPTECVWHLVCETRLGRISILKNLDERTARETYKKLRPDEKPIKYEYSDTVGREGLSSSRSYRSTDDWLEKVHIIGPEEIELNPWFGVEPTVVFIRNSSFVVPVKTSRSSEDVAHEKLHKDVPAAFWLHPDFDSSHGNKPFSSVE